MKKKELILVSLGFIIVLILIISVTYIRYRGKDFGKGIIGQASKIFANDKKNFNDSRFSPTKEPVSYLNKCKATIKYDNALLQETNTNDTTTIERTLLTTSSKKSGVDILCIDMPNIANQIKTIINRQYDKSAEETQKILGINKDEFSKKLEKDIYQLYLVRNVENNCQIKNNLVNLRSIHSKLETDYSSDYVDCDVTKKTEGGDTTYNYRYLFSKDEKFVLQLGEVNSSEVKNSYLVFKE